MRGTHRTTWIAVAVGIVAALVVPARAAEPVRDEAMIRCVEGGGLYYDDGHCEGGSAGDPVPPNPEPGAKSDPGVDYGDQDGKRASADDSEAVARKKCRDQGGRWRSDGTCKLSRDPVDRCEDAGGLFMVDGRCFRPNY